MEKTLKKSTYYSDYVNIEDVSQRPKSSIVKVKFNKWRRGSKFPKVAILKWFYGWQPEFQKEATALKDASKRFPNIVVKYYHRQMIEGRYCIFMELCENVSVGKQMQDGVNWNISTRLRISSEIAYALAVLHSGSEPIAHRDIKPDNIFLTGNDEVRLGDFDFVKEIRTSSDPHTVSGTPEYMSPFLRKLYDLEIKKSSLVDPLKEDVWSTGKTIYEIITRQDREALLRKYYEDNKKSELEKENEVREEARRKMQQCGLQTEAQNIILAMLIFDKNERITMADASFRFKNLPSLEETKYILDENGLTSYVDRKVLETNGFSISEFTSKNNSNFESGSISEFYALSINSQTYQNLEYQTSSDEDLQEDEEIDIDKIESDLLEMEENKISSSDNTETSNFMSIETTASLDNAGAESEEFNGFCEKCKDVDRISSFLEEMVTMGYKYREITCVGCKNLFPKKIYQCKNIQLGILPDDFYDNTN